MQQFFALSLGFGAMIFLAGQAQGQAAQCGERDRVVAGLTQAYGDGFGRLHEPPAPAGSPA